MSQSINRTRQRGLLRKYVDFSPVVAILGPRQSGKSTLARTMEVDHHGIFIWTSVGRVPCWGPGFIRSSVPGGAPVRPPKGGTPTGQPPHRLPDDMPLTGSTKPGRQALHLELEII